MNDLVRRAHLLPTQLQLPVQAYFDEAVFQREKAMFERLTSRYVGHRQWVPEPGDWRTLAHEGGGRVLVHGREGVQLLSKRHRQVFSLPVWASLSRSMGTPRRMECPCHYDNPPSPPSPRRAVQRKKCFGGRNHRQTDLFRIHMVFSTIS